MSNEPTITERPAQPYMSIGAKCSLSDIGTIVPRLTQEVSAWLRSHDVRPVGPPFWKYNVVAMEGTMEIEAGFPIGEPVAGDDRVHGGVLPAGRYATLVHVGHPDKLYDATVQLLEWAKDQGLDWDVAPSPDGDRWACRLEIYRDEPGQPMDEWETELAFRLA